jgi:hypothetical protein
MYDVRDSLRGLHCGILENKNIGNCSNGGISSKVNAVTVILTDRDTHVFEPSVDAPAVKIIHRVIAGKDYYHAEPIEPARGNGWYCFGGCYITTSDSRFPFRYPIALHDRQEGGQ